MVSCFKMAEDNSDEYILRVFEAHGEPADAVISLPRTAEVRETNMLEESTSSPVGNGREIRATFRPHEIKTFRIRFDSRRPAFRSLKVSMR